MYNNATTPYEGNAAINIAINAMVGSQEPHSPSPNSIGDQSQPHYTLKKKCSFTARLVFILSGISGIAIVALNLNQNSSFATQQIASGVLGGVMLGCAFYNAYKISRIESIESRASNEVIISDHQLIEIFAHIRVLFEAQHLENEKLKTANAQLRQSLVSTNENRVDLGVTVRTGMDELQNLHALKERMIQRLKIEIGILKEYNQKLKSETPSPVQDSNPTTQSKEETKMQENGEEIDPLKEDKAEFESLNKDLHEEITKLMSAKESKKSNWQIRTPKGKGKTPQLVYRKESANSKSRPPRDPKGSLKIMIEKDSRYSTSRSINTPVPVSEATTPHSQAQIGSDSTGKGSIKLTIGINNKTTGV